jgi:predicted nucleic acid-binding protein
VIALVLDCSAVMRWWIPGTESPWAPEAPTGFLAPEFLRVEWASTLLKLVRHRGLDPGAAFEFRQRLERLGTHWIPDAGLLDGAWSLAASGACSVYDGLYVSLARATRSALATADRKMAMVAKQEGIKVRWAGGS